MQHEVCKILKPLLKENSCMLCNKTSMPHTLYNGTYNYDEDKFISYKLTGNFKQYRNVITLDYWATVETWWVNMAGSTEEVSASSVDMKNIIMSLILM